MAGKRRLGLVVLAIWAGTVVAGCGDGGGGSSMDAWEDRHGEQFASLGRELAGADAALGEGDRDAILGACNLLNDALTEFEAEALPLPDPGADQAVRDAVVDSRSAVESCLAGGRSAAAADVEAAMALVDDARESFDRAEVFLVKASATTSPSAG